MRKKNNITIFANVHRKPAEKTPHFRGLLDVEGETYEVALWVNYELGGFPVHMSGQIELAEEE